MQKQRLLNMNTQGFTIHIIETRNKEKVERTEKGNEINENKYRVS